MAVSFRFSIFGIRVRIRVRIIATGVSRRHRPSLPSGLPSKPLLAGRRFAPFYSSCSLPPACWTSSARRRARTLARTRPPLRLLLVLASSALQASHARGHGNPRPFPSKACAKASSEAKKIGLYLPTNSASSRAPTRASTTPTLHAAPRRHRTRRHFSRRPRTRTAASVTR